MTKKTTVETADSTLPVDVVTSSPPPAPAKKAAAPEWTVDSLVDVGLSCCPPDVASAALDARRDVLTAVAKMILAAR